MNLTIDAGNTAVKIAVFDNKRIVYRHLAKKISLSVLKNIIHKFNVTECAISSVVNLEKELVKRLGKLVTLTILSPHVKLPVRIKYNTPNTLGQDRLANAIAANSLFPGRNILVIDLGTCIKYDFINAKAEYIGGSITPGIVMRFKAMNAFTGKLPLVKFAKPKSFIGYSTETALQTGVYEGVKGEILQFVKLYKQKHKQLKVILTGGDAQGLVRQFKISIFAAADLVNIGLNEILRYNAEQ